MDIAIILNCPYKVKGVKESDIIYTDGGYKNRKYNKGKNALAVVGDFDTLKRIPQKEKVIKLDKEKDFTDGERAVRYAKEVGATTLSIYGGTGGRIEHILGNIALLKIAKKLQMEAKLIEKNCEIYLAENKFTKKVKKGQIVSIIPNGDECKVSSSKGLYYPLNNLKLTKSDTIGISNYATEEEISLKIESGEILIIINK